MQDRTPEYTGSFQYIERCDGLIRSFHNFMVENSYDKAINVLRSFHSELIPYMKKNKKIDQLTECNDQETKTLSSINNSQKKKNIYVWFRLLNQVYHGNGLAFKMNDNTFFSADMV